MRTAAERAIKLHDKIIITILRKKSTEVHEDIAIVYGNWMAAECRLNFVIIILTVV